MSLLPLAPPPRQRQGSPFLDHMPHQRYTPAPDHAAIDHQPQLLQGERRQPERGIGEQRDLLRHCVVVHPPGKAFDTALGLSAVGDLRRAVRQLRAFASDEAPDERGEGR